jgi:DNA ligase D-like protein (predicted ligase)
MAKVIRKKAFFIEPMLLRRTDTLPDDPKRLMYELKMDGYRAIAFKTVGRVHLRSRNDNDFALRYPSIAKALSKLPNETVIDGEVVAFDASGKPSFNTLQNHGSAPDTPLVYFVFDVMMLAGKNVMHEPLKARRALLEKHVLPKLSDPIRYSPELQGSLLDLIAAVKAQGLEGLVSKRRDSVYESGLRSGEWHKMRINQGQELVIGGYTIGSRNFDAIVLGYYKEGKLLYASRTRNGFTPAVREQLFRIMKPLEILDCPFANLPEKQGGRWGQGLTAAKMKDCRWLRPKLVGQFEFVEWTPDDHLRHTRFVALREDKKAKDVMRETS